MNNDEWPENYCRTHDLFHCPFAHDVGQGWKLPTPERPTWALSWATIRSGGRTVVPFGKQDSAWEAARQAQDETGIAVIVGRDPAGWFYTAAAAVTPPPGYGHDERSDDDDEYDAIMARGWVDESCPDCHGLGWVGFGPDDAWRCDTCEGSGHR